MRLLVLELEEWAISKQEESADTQGAHTGLLQPLPPLSTLYN